MGKSTSTPEEFAEVVSTVAEEAPLSIAMRNVLNDEQIAAALAESMAVPAPPVFNTHSQALVGLLVAQENGLREKAADVRQRIADLEAEYTDIMLAQSGVTHALRAITDGR